MSTILIKKNRGLHNPLITKQLDTRQTRKWYYSKIKTGDKTDLSGMMINKGDGI